MGWISTDTSTCRQDRLLSDRPVSESLFCAYLAYFLHAHRRNLGIRITHRCYSNTTLRTQVQGHRYLSHDHRDHVGLLRPSFKACPLLPYVTSFAFSMPSFWNNTKEWSRLDMAPFLFYVSRQNFENPTGLRDEITGPCNIHSCPCLRRSLNARLMLVPAGSVKPPFLCSTRMVSAWPAPSFGLPCCRVRLPRQPRGIGAHEHMAVGTFMNRCRLLRFPFVRGYLANRYVRASRKPNFHPGVCWSSLCSHIPIDRSHC
ncbi:hypothetical protein BD779DRAFT_618504 [Infundibulicybe gibba]|nr:hypothetical protein BD779DRAFT_618504 [Infundibulicybe gibba]